MRLQFLLPALAVMASTARAAMNLFVNDCEWDIYVTQVGIAGPEGGTQLLSAGHMTHVPQFNTGTGTSVKFTKTPNGLFTSSPVLQFVYTYEANKEIWYGISMDHGYDYNGQVVMLGGQYGTDVEEIIWNGQPGPVYTAQHKGETDLVFTMCAKMSNSTKADASV